MYLRIGCGIFFCCIFIVFVTKTDDLDICNDCVNTKGNESLRVLSRNKRFLIFPEGSSLQLVFCVQTAALIPIGDIFLYGSTAALAWSLPNDPKFIEMLKENEKIGQRREDNKHVSYINENGKLVARVPYKRPAIVNPAFAKRSTDEKMNYKERLKIKIDRAKMHERQSNRDFLKKDSIDADSLGFHRSSRVGLYEKLEPLITALGGDGRRCVLRKLCESARISRQGTFLQELLAVVFTLPKGEEFEETEHKHYDMAHNPDVDCATLYPCDVMSEQL